MSDYEPLRKRARLTKGNLETLSKSMTRSKPAPSIGSENRKRKAAPTSESKHSTKTTSTSTTTTTSPELGTQLAKNGVITHLDASIAPKDFAAVVERLRKDRATPPPTESMYNQYNAHRIIRHTEMLTTGRLWATICKDMIIPKTPGMRDGFHEQFNLPWSRLDNQLTAGISHAKPDYSQSFMPLAYPSYVEEDILPEVRPSDYDFVMPSFAAELKSTSANAEVADLQSAYNGALMNNNAMQLHVLSGGAIEDFYGKTAAITAAYNGADLKLFAHHAQRGGNCTNGHVTSTAPHADETLTSELLQPAARSPESSACSDEQPIVEFHQYMLYETSRKDHEGLKLDYKALRNAQDLGYELACERQRQAHAIPNPRKAKKTAKDIPQPAEPDGTSAVK